MISAMGRAGSFHPGWVFCGCSLSPGELHAGQMASWNSSHSRKVPLWQPWKITGFALWGFPLRAFPPGGICHFKRGQE